MNDAQRVPDWMLCLHFVSWCNGIYPDGNFGGAEQCLLDLLDGADAWVGITIDRAIEQAHLDDTAARCLREFITRMRELEAVPV